MAYCALLHNHIRSSTYETSFSLRPIDHATKVFAMAVLGPGTILEGQDNPSAMKGLFLKHVGRTDVTFGEFPWYSFFK